MDKNDQSVDRVGTSQIGRSGFRKWKQQLSLWPETTIPSLNLESNLYSCSGGTPHQVGQPHPGATARGAEPVLSDEKPGIAILAKTETGSGQ